MNKKLLQTQRFGTNKSDCDIDHLRNAHIEFLCGVIMPEVFSQRFQRFPVLFLSNCYQLREAFDIEAKMA